MADNIAITAGSGTTVATQDEGGVHYQEVKLVASGTGTTAALSKAEDAAHTSGDHGLMALSVRANTAAATSGTDGDYQPLITDTNGRLHVLDENSAAIKTAVETIDNAIAGSEMQVDIVTSALPTGAATSAKQDTIIGHVDGVETLLGTIDADTSNISTKIDTVADDTTSIQTAIELIDDTVFAEDVAAQAADKGIGILAVRRDADTSLVGTDNDYANLQVNATGALKVEIFDGGDSHTIDGTVTANLSATDNTVLDNIDTSTAAAATSLGTLDNAISGSEMQVDVVGALPAGTNAIGKLAANSGVDIGDVDITSIAAGNNNIGDVDIASIAAGTNAIGKVIPPDYDVTSHTAKAVKYYTSAGAATDGIIWSPAAGKRWHVTTLFINISAAATVTIEDDLAAGDNPVMKMELAANSGVAIPFGDLYPFTSGEDAADLLITTSAGNVYVTAVGYEI